MQITSCVFHLPQVPRLLFKRLVSVEYAQVLSLHAGEAYAMQNLTRTDRLGLLLSGKVIAGMISRREGSVRTARGGQRTQAIMLLHHSQQFSLAHVLDILNTSYVNVC